VNDPRADREGLVGGLIDVVDKPFYFYAHGGSSVTFRDPALPCRARLSSPSRKARRRFARGRQNEKGRLLTQPTFLILVPTEGLEPPHLAAHGPEPCASTNSATWASLFAACCCSNRGEPELYRTRRGRSMPGRHKLRTVCNGQQGWRSNNYMYLQGRVWKLNLRSQGRE
jgi:hypothetical protein